MRFVQYEIDVSQVDLLITRRAFFKIRCKTGDICVQAFALLISCLERKQLHLYRSYVGD